MGKKKRITVNPASVQKIMKEIDKHIDMFFAHNMKMPSHLILPLHMRAAVEYSNLLIQKLPAETIITLIEYRGIPIINWEDTVIFRR